eukprot:TRINITY_DN10035_c0_g1_i2.p1 TRINITY_DN10035_c0_g1~~TRINITY_DN10035_c0_g1_i2.p1  ORF type:complete len:538 (-),score=120.73 TRINITY_DN10035_c0_g1_i2:189-1802(-)
MCIRDRCTWVCALVCVSGKPRPNILAIFADDLGWYDTSIHNPNAPTPRLAALNAEGLRLEHQHVFRYCSPTRRSFLSGRFPNHLTTVQPDGANMCSDFLPLNLSTIAEKLSSVNYSCHFVGKGHLGYETTDHLPINRGFASHVGYLGGSEGYAHGSGSADPTKGTHDMWQDHAPGLEAVTQMDYSANYYAQTGVRIIQEHAERKASSEGPSDHPFFMYFAIQNVHSPYTLPPSWETSEYPRMWDHTYSNMLAIMDSAIGNLTDALKTTGLWEDTLILFTADNGGIDRGNNYPLRGHKHDPWQGGTRATAFLSGGFLPAGVRGTASGAKLVHVADWYPTFCGLAGVDSEDRAVFGGQVKGIDGVDVWPMLTGFNHTQPRALTPTTEVSVIDTGDAQSWWKLITLAGQSTYYYENQSSVPMDKSECLAGNQPDPPQPGRTDPLVNGCPVCNATSPCLFDILADPQERHNLAAQHPEVVARLTPVVEQYQKYYVLGHLSATELQAYDQVNQSKWGGYTGPCYIKRQGSWAVGGGNGHSNV